MFSAQSSGDLKDLETWWGVVLEAHADPNQVASSARQSLLERYSAAVYRYLLGAVRNSEAASELSQEFALRLLRGDFHRVAPDRGRFRDYIRSVLINMVRKHYRTERKRPLALTDECSVVAAETGSPTFEECVRDAVLQRTWQALQQANQRYHAILLYRVKNPALSSDSMAELLTRWYGTRWNAAQVRKTLERARTLFVELLLREVSSVFQCTDEEDVLDALEGLGLMKYCRNAINRGVHSGHGPATRRPTRTLKPQQPAPTCS